jgi:hypothetical protein
MVKGTVAQAKSPPSLLLISEIITEHTKKVKKCCGVSESVNFYTVKGRSVPVNRLVAGKKKQLFL